MKEAESELFREREWKREKGYLEEVKTRKNGFIYLFNMRNGRFEQGNSQRGLGTLGKKQKKLSDRIKECS